MFRSYATALLVTVLVLQTGCQNAGTVEFTNIECAVLEVDMDAPGQVKVTASSSVMLTCYWADKELHQKIASGKFLSPQDRSDAIKSHLISVGKRDFSETIDLPAGKIFISIQSFGTASYRVSADYSIEKL